MMRKFDELQFKDDFMFGAVMSNQEICKGMLELILNVKIKKIKYMERQNSIYAAPFSKGIRLYIYLDDEDETVYSVEMQQKHIKDSPKMARYYQSINDMRLLEECDDYDQINKSIIIFICDYDPFYEKMYQYTFENRCIEQLDLKLEDEAVEIFLNTKGQEGNISQELKDLLAYIGDPQNMSTEPLIMKIDEEVKRVRVDPESKREFMLLEVKLNEKKKS